MNGFVFTETYSLPPVNLDEVLRYAGSAGGGEELRMLAEDCIREAGTLFESKVCWLSFPLREKGRYPDLLEGSASLKRYLSGCDEVLLFAATVGMGIDRLTAKYSRLSPSRGVMMQALGAERIEALCDAFCEDMSHRLTGTLRPRFSPGYGDWPLQVQREIFRLLQPHRKIGLCLNESLLMSPTKSVTAIFGVRSVDAGKENT